MPFVYILECADGTFYTGWTADLTRRVADHNAGRGGRYTRARRPVRLVYWEVLPDRASAQRRELALKRAGRNAKERLIAAAREGGQAGEKPTPDDILEQSIAEDNDV
jgi:putative endonuclease